jgi:hypothetical protein
MSEWKFKEIVEVLENADHRPQPYTGRNMYGKVCLSVQCDDDSDLVLKVIKSFVDAALESNPKELNRRAPGVLEHTSSLIEKLTGSSVDRLGHGFVVYWPSIKWEDEQAASVDADDEGEYERTEKVSLDSIRHTTLPSAVNLDSVSPRGKK